MHLLGREREKCLPGTTELAKTGEYHTDSLLYPLVGIQTQPDLAMPDIANRPADPQVAAKSLPVLGIVHARANDAELKLADAALHAQQQTIVRSARIIYAVGINHSGADQSTEVEQVMP